MNKDENKPLKLELTADVIEVIDNYIFSKVCRLEDNNLKETYCYPRLFAAHREFSRALKAAREVK